MNDYSLPLLTLRKLSKDYENAMLKRQWALAYQISVDLVEVALKLQDLSDED